MATHTRRELVTQALYDLGVAYPGQAAASEDYSDVDKFLDGLIAQLRIRSIANVQDDEAIEEEFFRPLALLLANEAKAEFGGGNFDVAGAEARLREMTRSGPTYETAEVDYF